MSQTNTAAKPKKRLLSLDVLRGITIAGMILVNNPGTWSHIYAPLQHAAWNGCTPTDLVFPFFVFCMGIAMYISYGKFNYELNLKTFSKLLTRGLLIILIGWALSWYGMFMRQITTDHTFAYAIWYYPIEHLRFLGVFPRLGLITIFGTLLMLTCKPRNCLWVSLGLLVVYCILQSVTNSFELNEANMESVVDLLVLGDNHIYHLGGIPFDPEGILSTIPAVAHALIGVWVGRLIMHCHDNWDKVTRVLLAGAVMLLFGFCLDYAYPINKSMWSASYVFVTCGLASLLLGILIWILDIRLPELNSVEPATRMQRFQHGFANRWYKFFECFGVNPLFIFCLSAIFVNTMNNIRFTFRDEVYNVWSFWYKVCMQPLFGDTGGSLASALSLILVLWLIAHILYRKKIYIKL